MLNFSGAESWEYFFPPVLLSAVLVFSIDLVQSGTLRIPSRLQPAARPILVVASVVLLICLALIYHVNGGDSRPFIYGQF